MLQKETVKNQERQQKKYHDSPTYKLRDFTSGDKVKYKIFNLVERKENGKRKQMRKHWDQ